jgi:hypothetical protein
LCKSWAAGRRKEEKIGRVYVGEFITKLCPPENVKTKKRSQCLEGRAMP